MKQKHTQRQKNKLMVTKGEREGEINQEFIRKEIEYINNKIRAKSLNIKQNTKNKNEINTWLIVKINKFSKPDSQGLG